MEALLDRVRGLIGKCSTYQSDCPAMCRVLQLLIEGSATAESVRTGLVMELQFLGSKFAANKTTQTTSGHFLIILEDPDSCHKILSTEHTALYK